jgi:hypothetical protein
MALYRTNIEFKAAVSYSRLHFAKMKKATVSQHNGFSKNNLPKIT